MRRAYSAHACSAQAGSLAATATTCSLATRALLRCLLCAGCARGGLLHSHGLAAPYFFQVVEVAHRRMHAVHDYVADVHPHPFTVAFALDAVPPRAVLPHLLLHAVAKRLYLARAFAARDRYPLEPRRHPRAAAH